MIAVFYGMGPFDLENSGQGTAILEDINVVELNDFDAYLNELAARARGSSR